MHFTIAKTLQVQHHRWIRQKMSARIEAKAAMLCGNRAIALCFSINRAHTSVHMAASVACCPILFTWRSVNLFLYVCFDFGLSLLLKPIISTSRSSQFYFPLLHQNIRISVYWSCQFYPNVSYRSLKLIVQKRIFDIKLQWSDLDEPTSKQALDVVMKWRHVPSGFILSCTVN